MKQKKKDSVIWRTLKILIFLNHIKLNNIMKRKAELITAILVLIILFLKNIWF